MPTADSPTPDDFDPLLRRKPIVAGDVGRRKDALVRRLLGGGLALPQPGRYELCEEIGRGGMGSVYRAWDPKLQRFVAVKMLSPGVTSARRQARLMREARGLAALAHPNVVEVLDVGATAGRPWMAMELLEGRDLRKWLSGPTRTAGEILEVYTAAGEGLAAAHAAGLIHRDFKPSNVMVGDFGVKVLDFGLVREGGTVPPGGDSTGDVHTPPRSFDSTRTGAMLGTPRYISPEQLHGAPVDHRCDQFSFCVALGEALLGEHPLGAWPFANDHDRTHAEVFERLASRLPTPIRKALARGLRMRPAARFSGMTALVAALRGHKSPRRRSLLVVAATIAIALPAAGLVLGRDGVCDNPVAATWNEDTRAAVVRATATDAGAMAAELEAYAERLSAAYGDLCTDRSDHAAQRRACLTRRRRALAAVVDFVGRPSATARADRIRAIADLPGIDRCDESDYLADGIRLPPPIAAEQVDRVRADLDRAIALQYAGRYPDSIQVARRAVERAERSGYDPAVAEAALGLGKALIWAERHKEARVVLERAAWLAIAHDHPELQLEAATWLVEVVGFFGDDPVLAEVWADRARAVVERTSDPAVARASVDWRVGHAHERAGDYESARQYVARALAAQREHLPPDHPELLETLGTLGNIAFYQGEDAEARALWEEALEGTARSLSLNHFEVARLENRLGALARRQGRFAEAAARFERALTLGTRLKGEVSLFVAGVLHSQANLALDQDDPDRAERLLIRAIDAWTELDGELAPSAAWGWSTMSRVHVLRGDLELAADALDRAAEIARKTWGEAHPKLLRIEEQRRALSETPRPPA